MKLNIYFLLLVTLIISNVLGQTNPNININLLLDYSSADQTIQLLEDRLVNTQILAELKGSRIAASTTGLIANNFSVTQHLQNYLDSLRYHQIIKDDVYHLETAREHVQEIKELFNEIKKSNFNRRVVATVEQIFPTDSRISILIPVYVVAIGHENVDAYVRRIIWHGNTPEFAGEGEGELTIVINLGQSVKYGPDLQERFISLLGVVAHEVFHAAYGAYKENSGQWKRYYKKYKRPFDYLLDITQNEGIAYYLSLDQRGRGYVPTNWDTNIREAFSTFDKNAKELLSGSITGERANELIKSANLSGYWESYGAMTGMAIAREIDLRLGRAELIEAVGGTPFDFFRKYLNVLNTESILPRLSPRIIAEFNQK